MVSSFNTLTLLKKLTIHNFVLFSSISHTKVNILFSGGSNHEPSHAEHTGNGMLTGTILCETFLSSFI